MQMQRRCSRCKVFKDGTEFYYSLKYTYYYCKSCYKVLNRQNIERRMENPPTIVRTHKVCVMCKEDKPISQYGVNNQRADKRHSYCKPCWIIYVKKAQKKRQNLL